MLKNYSLILKEVFNIASTKREYNDIQFKFKLHTTKSDININFFESIEFKADYNNNVGDIIFIHFNIGLGDFNYDILPFKNNLEISMVKSFNNEPYENITYKAILLTNSDNYNGIKSNINKDILNKSSIIRLTLQLVEKNIEVIRTINIDGIYKNTDVKNLIIPIIYNNTNKIKINGESLNPLINIVEPDNKSKYDHILIPTGTLLIDLASYLQDTRYGVYNGDIGFYIKNIRESLMNYRTCFFIFPLYSKKEDIYDSLHIYHTDHKINKGMDNTYDYKNKILKVITSEVDIIEKGEKEFINNGNSIAYGSMENITDYNSTVTNDKITYSKKKQVSNETYEKEDKLVRETFIGNKSNLHKYYSNLSNKELGLYKFHWVKSNHRHLLPGMNTTVFFQIDKEIKKLQGILQGYYSIYNQALKLETTILMIKLKEVNDD